MYKPNTFQQALKKGDHFEAIAKTMLNPTTFVKAPEGEKSYDFFADDIPYEVKSDAQGWDTGNLVIEHECNQVPSGITSTIAKEWFYFVNKPDDWNVYRCYRIPVSDLREMIQSCREVRGGNGGRAFMYLLPQKRVEQYRV